MTTLVNYKTSLTTESFADLERRGAQYLAKEIRRDGGDLSQHRMKKKIMLDALTQLSSRGQRDAWGVQYLCAEVFAELERRGVYESLVKVFRATKCETEFMIDLAAVAIGLLVLALHVSWADGNESHDEALRRLVPSRFERAQKFVNLGCCEAIVRLIGNTKSTKRARLQWEATFLFKAIADQYDASKLKWTPPSEVCRICSRALLDEVIFHDPDVIATTAPARQQDQSKTFMNDGRFDAVGCLVCLANQSPDTLCCTGVITDLVAFLSRPRETLWEPVDGKDLGFFVLTALALLTEHDVSLTPEFRPGAEILLKILADTQIDSRIQDCNHGRIPITCLTALEKLARCPDLRTYLDGDLQATKTIKAFETYTSSDHPASASRINVLAAALRADLQNRRTCLACGKSAASCQDDYIAAGNTGPFPGMSKCSKCRVATYCSRQCQLSHWSLHKAACKDLANARSDARAALRRRPSSSSDLLSSNTNAAPLLSLASSISENGGYRSIASSISENGGLYRSMASSISENGGLYRSISSSISEAGY